MRRAIALSFQGVGKGGGLFGAVGGRILGEGRNAAVPARDPIARAEVVAIRAACEALGTHDPSGAVSHAGCAPCPMRLGAIRRARIGGIVDANDPADAAATGFHDAAIDEEVCRPVADRALPRLLGEEAMEGFRLWQGKADKVPH